MEKTISTMENNSAVFVKVRNTKFIRRQEISQNYKNINIFIILNDFLTLNKVCVLNKKPGRNRHIYAHRVLGQDSRNL